VLSSAKKLKLPDIMRPLLDHLSFEQAKEILPSMVSQVHTIQEVDYLEIPGIVDWISKNATQEQQAEMIYLILKQKLPQEQSFVKKLSIFTDALVDKVSVKEVVLKVVERLVKNEKWHCRVLIKLIIQIQMKELDLASRAQELIKKAIKKNILGSKEDWDVNARGLVAYFMQN